EDALDEPRQCLAVLLIQLDGALRDPEADRAFGVAGQALNPLGPLTSVQMELLPCDGVLHPVLLLQLGHLLAQPSDFTGRDADAPSQSLVRVHLVRSAHELGLSLDGRLQMRACRAAVELAGAKSGVICAPAGSLLALASLAQLLAAIGRLRRT